MSFRELKTQPMFDGSRGRIFWIVFLHSFTRFTTAPTKIVPIPSLSVHVSISGIDTESPFRTCTCALCKLPYNCSSLPFGSLDNSDTCCTLPVSSSFLFSSPASCSSYCSSLSSSCSTPSTYTYVSASFSLSPLPLSPPPLTPPPPLSLFGQTVPLGNKVLMNGKDLFEAHCLR